MIIAIFGLTVDPAFSPDMTRFFSLLNERRVKAYIYKPFYDLIASTGHISPELVAGLFTTGAELPEAVSYLFSIGGDGTFLKSILTLRHRSIPVIGINSGRLGFLSAISREDMEWAIDDVLNEEYVVEERTLLQVDGVADLFGDFNYVMNEITVTKMDTSSMINIHTYLNEKYITTYWADGLIISTPTGSTAYSLSVGGPILTPDSSDIVITPIAPHNLTMRPIVIPDHNRLTLRVEGRGQQFLASLDSRSKAVNFPGEIHIRKAGFRVKTIKLREHDFFNTLRNKLMWGTDRRN
ncbi:MAG: NAD kinase [Prolixibacteraceae bacterium]